MMNNQPITSPSPWKVEAQEANIGSIQDVLLPLVNLYFYDTVMQTMYPGEIFFETNTRFFREWMDLVFFLEKQRPRYQIPPGK